MFINKHLRKYKFSISIHKAIVKVFVDPLKLQPISISLENSSACSPLFPREKSN